MHFLEKLASSLSVTLAIVIIAVAAAVFSAIYLFDVSVTGAIAFYFVVWWTVLFVTLPIAIRTQNEFVEPPAAGTDPGAPVTPRMRERAIMTTFFSDIVFFVSLLILQQVGL